jgi:adenine-specific DNA-methyltransferase
VLRKLLASSTFAIAGALASLSARLKDTLRSADPAAPLTDVLDEDYEALDETAEEWSDEEVAEPLTKADEAALRHEIADLEAFSSLATSIQRNAKGEALVKALRVGFAQAAELGAARKAIIFTESRRTQNYLLRRLADSEFAEGLVLFNGANTDERSRAIYAAWWERHRGTDRVTGSRSADMRSALVDYFRDEGRIMIATEAGAEGINLQFCSLVVNYDLPWNPQRIEQRIGRCHRYGQRHDVVVVNFINRRNEADKRVYELLRDKFKLFEGVFGASDEVLGAIESGVDIEKRIADIYQRCRRPEEIRAAFDQLQLELDAEISAEMSQTRRKLLDNFDDDVREKLRVRDADSKAVLSAFERRLMLLTRAELADDATFDGDSAFVLERCPFGDGIPLGRYELPRRSPDAHIYRLAHPLAQAVIERARQCQLPPATITFRYAEHDGKISILEPWLGSSGWLAVMALTVSALDQAEDYLIPVAFTDDGQPLDRETVERLLALPGRHAPLPSAQLDWGDAQPQLPSPDGSWGEAQATLTPAVGHPRLGELVTAEVQAITQGIAERNARFFEAEVEKLEGWADDLKLGLERDIKELDRRIKEARRAATVAATLAEKLEGQKQVRALEAERSQKRRSLFDAQDEVDQRRQGLIEAIEAKLAQETRLEHLFTVRWRLT